MSIYQIEWHDLPISNIMIGENKVSIEVTPFNDAKDDYDSFLLTLSGFADLNIFMDSVMDVEAMIAMEVTSFEFVEVGDRLSGKISILPGSKGFWSIEFREAEWSFGSTLNK